MSGRPEFAVSVPLLLIGAGPAGLALAFELKRRGFPARLLERGPAAGHSWTQMPRRLQLVSPWKANCLPGADRGAYRPNQALGCAAFARALADYARAHELSIVPNTRVHAVTRTEGRGFAVQTSAGTFHTSLLVNATGWFANPVIPDFPGARESSLPQHHFATYGDAERLRRDSDGTSGPVLVVGRRLSAGQVLVELTDAGIGVALSCRGPVAFGAGPLGSWIFFRVHPALERLQLRWRGAAARGYPPVMPGGRARRLIEGGRVPVFPDIARFEGRRVVFVDGRHLEPAAVLYATGFRPALAHLGPVNLTMNRRTGQPALRGFESTDAPGLFFVGLDHLRNFRSRFLRGIREDAPLLADELAARLRSICSRPGEPGCPTAPAASRR